MGFQARARTGSSAIRPGSSHFRAAGLETVFVQNQTSVQNMLRKKKKYREFQPLAKAAPITADEARSLVGAIAKGDAAARERLILSHLRLAARIAYRWKGRGLDPDDLIAEATCGLIRAIDRYNPTQEASFHTFASYYIKQAVARAVEESGNLLSLPASTWKLVRRWKRAVRELTATLGRVPTTEEIAESLKLTRYADEQRYFGVDCGNQAGFDAARRRRPDYASRDW